ncbi:hypothetical protein ACIQVK_53220 [Streptomyces sp. NPDC090493]|uniref:hypothetical protein n=1 Tax=Streptomyces sp. NPDC090493 TaxID=3365964 RepID=UPI00383060B6
MQRATVFPTRTLDPVTDRREPPGRPAETEPDAPRAGRGRAPVAGHRPTGRSVPSPEDFQ